MRHGDAQSARRIAPPMRRHGSEMGRARIAPIVATPTYERYSRKGLFELKWDGERCLAFRHGSVLMLYSRSP
jgi:ATP-dependent DNA ligase